jgi:tetratricopeptide (TPR) repeat protein
MTLLNTKLESNPNDAELLKQRVWLYSDLHRWDDVSADVSAILTQEPNDFAYRRFRGWASMRLAQWQRAYDDFTAVLEIVPDQLHYWPGRCRAAVELGLDNEAVTDANRLVELTEKYPTFADSLTSEFMLQHAVGRFPEATLALARQAIQRHPKSDVYRGELGGVQFYLGLYRDAVENLSPAAAGGPSETSAFAGFWLAMSYCHLGEIKKAQSAYRQAVRNWKGIPALRLEEEQLLQSLWQEAQAMLNNSGPSVALAGQ